MRELLGPLFIVIGFGVLAVGVGFSVERSRCVNEWYDYQPTWGPLEGCRISVMGKRTPTSAIRELRP